MQQISIFVDVIGTSRNATIFDVIGTSRNATIFDVIGTSRNATIFVDVTVTYPCSAISLIAFTYLTVPREYLPKQYYPNDMSKMSTF